MPRDSMEQGALAWLEHKAPGRAELATVRPEAPPRACDGGARSAPPLPTEGSLELGAPLMTADEVAAHLRCSVELVYKLRRTGRLKAVRLGALYRWKTEVVRAFVEAAEGK
jgi:excisionase family DNA binding protein